MRKLFLLLLLTAGSFAQAAMHQHMMMDENGMIMNANADKLPTDCTAISETVNITIHAGQKYSAPFPGKMFAFDKQEWQVKPCAKIIVTFINDDEIRHQLMIHGLPGYLYPDGMFHLELNGKGKLQAPLIVPRSKKTYLVHCELPQHMEKGMKAQLKVDGGSGDLPGIPGISKPIKADSYPVDWTFTSLGMLVLSLLAGILLPVLLINNARRLWTALSRLLTKR